MRARNAKKRHFQVETLEERLALDGTMTSNVTVTTDNMSRPMISLVGPRKGNSSVSYNVDYESSTNVTVADDEPSTNVTVTPWNPVSYGATVVLPAVPTVVLPAVPTVVLPPDLGVSGTMVGP